MCSLDGSRPAERHAKEVGCRRGHEQVPAPRVTSCSLGVLACGPRADRVSRVPQAQLSSSDTSSQSAGLGGVPRRLRELQGVRDDRRREKAAARNSAAASVRCLPLNLVLRKLPTVFSQPKTSSIRLRMRWLTA